MEEEKEEEEEQEEGPQTRPPSSDMDVIHTESQLTTRHLGARDRISSGKRLLAPRDHPGW